MSGNATLDLMMKELAKDRMAGQLLEISNEVDKYLADPFETINATDFDLLLWRNVNQSKYPILSTITHDIFAIPSSTVASENAFSLGGRIVDPFRASLTPKMVEAFVCTSDWLRAEEFNFYKNPTDDELQFYKELEELEAMSQKLILCLHLGHNPNGCNAYCDSMKCELPAKWLPTADCPANLVFHFEV